MARRPLDLPPRYNVSELLFSNLEAGRGDKEAIRTLGETVTYGELASTAARCGNALNQLGLSRGDRVLLLLLDTPTLPAAFFGTIRAGYLPIPTNTVLHPDSYLFFLRDSGAKAAIVDEALLPRLEGVVDQCPDLEHVIVTGPARPGALAWDQVIGAADEALDPAPTRPDEPAFWLYSSGSTGFPKGVVHLHRNVPYTVETYARQVLGMAEADVTFSASKAFHAYGLGNNITFPYAVGASTVLFSGRPTPGAAFDHVRHFRPTLFFTAPTLYAAMLVHEDAQPEDFASVRLCVSAAEALPPEIARQWKDRFGVEILDGIGSTEMLHIFISNRSGQVKLGSSGTPVPGYDARIVDEHGDPLPAGSAGDLLVSGGSAAPHYWNRPERTAHTMRDEWMFTGDRYRQDEDGYFFYEGRSDDMFKVSGLWVSPIEVENALLEHPDVFECAVVPVHDDDDLVRCKAFVILRADANRDGAQVQALQEHVKAAIAPYKYPRAVEFVDELPKTATGKIQRFKLRDRG